MSDTIDRQAAIDTLAIDEKLLKRILDNADIVGNKREKYEWWLGLTESHIADIKDLPSAQPEIIRCKDCKHRPFDGEDTQGFGVEFPDEKCPCQCEDGWYNWRPDDEWFCGNAKREGDLSEENREEEDENI